MPPGNCGQPPSLSLSSFAAAAVPRASGVMSCRRVVFQVESLNEDASLHETAFTYMAKYAVTNQNELLQLVSATLLLPAEAFSPCTSPPFCRTTAMRPPLAMEAADLPLLVSLTFVNALVFLSTCVLQLVVAVTPALQPPARVCVFLGVDHMRCSFSPHPCLV